MPPLMAMSQDNRADDLSAQLPTLLWLRAGASPRTSSLDVMRLDAEGWSVSASAERYGCADETVRQALKGAGVVIRRRPWERL